MIAQIRQLSFRQLYQKVLPLSVSLNYQRHIHKKDVRFLVRTLSRSIIHHDDDRGDGGRDGRGRDDDYGRGRGRDDDDGGHDDHGHDGGLHENAQLISKGR